MGEEGKKAKDFALFIICVFSFSIVIMGVSAAIIAEYGANKIAIAHLALSLFTLLVIPILSCAVDNREDAFYVYLITFCVYFPLMIALAVDPSTRNVLNKQAVQYANGTQKRASVVDATDNISDFIELPLNAGKFLAIFIFDCTLAASGFFGMVSVGCC